MKQAKAITANLLFALQILLLFLLLFEQQVELPFWLQPLGRMHPMLLHLPIGFLVLLAILPVLKKEIQPDAFYTIQSFLLYLAALTATVTAVMGLFLAQEAGYESDLVNWHKWFGVGVSFLTYGLLLWRDQFPKQNTVFNIAAGVNVLVLLIAGHLGASITHGEDYILAPIRPAKPAITADIPIFVATIQPILEEKCYNCHNESKAKGKLVMTSVEKLLKGGKHGPVWLAGHADSSLLVQRIYLPLGAEEHMPPEGKPQLTAEEIELLHVWIQAGADVQQVLNDLEKTDTLYLLANAAIQKRLVEQGDQPPYAFNFAAEKTIKELNNPFRSVYPVAIGSPALQAEIFVRQSYQPEFLQELTKIKEQLVSLNLTNMPIQDADLKTIAQFPNLEKLILNGTDISGQTLAELKVCTKLQSLALSNTAVQKEQLAVLHDFPALKKVYIWNTAISPEAVAELETELPNLHIDIGYVPDEEEVLKLSPPLLKNKSTLLAADELVQLDNKFPGATIRYTTDGSEPDSLESPVYEAPFSIKTYTVVKAKTFKENWQSSDLRTFTLFPQGQQPERAELLTTANPEYLGEGATTLYDGKKGDPNNFRTPYWLGYRDQPFDAYLYFDKQPPTVQEITLSVAQNIGSYLFPPTKIEIWGGADKTQLQRLAVVTPEQPTKYLPVVTQGIQIPLPSPSAFACYRIIAQPIARLPDWHQGKGQKGWIFIDEVFFY